MTIKNTVKPLIIHNTEEPSSAMNIPDDSSRFIQ
jgi:hypothetical protein